MTISFVSSGPGNPDLLTVLAVKRINDADIIFYDDLSSGEILNLAKKSFLQGFLLFYESAEPYDLITYLLFT